MKNTDRIRFTVARQTSFAAAFTIAVGGAYDPTTQSPTTTPFRSIQSGYWTSSGTISAVAEPAPNCR